MDRGEQPQRDLRAQNVNSSSSIKDDWLAMNVEEKKVKKFDFIHNYFTESAFTQLELFDRNARNMINIIRIESTLTEHLEEKQNEIGLTAESLLEAQQFLRLDILAKIMMLVEGFLALSDAISDPTKGYAGIAKAMTEYGLNMNFIARFKEKQIDLWKLTGLPDLKKLPINEQEREDLKLALDETVKMFEKFFATIIHFYECNKIPYNKFKHGMSLIPGMKLKSSTQGIVTSVVAALDTRDKSPDYTCFEMKDRLVPPDIGWFNTVCFVPPPQMGKNALIINSLLGVIPFLTSNHLFYAVNCGEDYFPLKQNPDGTYVPMLLFPQDSRYLEEDEKKRLVPIIEKVTRNMNIPGMTVDFKWNFSEEKMTKILKCFQDHGSALIWSSETDTGSAKVDLTY